MTDKRKDEMPEIRFIERHGNVEYSYRTNEFITKNEHWIVNGKRFDHAPTGKEVEAAYAAQSPPVPDDVAESARYLRGICQGIEIYEYDVFKVEEAYQKIIRAASTPSAVSIVRPIKSLTLGDKYIGKITEQEAVELVNAVIQSQIDISGTVVSTQSAEVQSVREILEFIANGCLVPPDGGEPCLADAMIEAKRGLKILNKIGGK